MSNTVIQIENLSKMYKLGVINNGTLWKDIQTWAALKFGHEDPHSKIGEDKYKGDADRFWALKNVSFSIKEGERVAIIGKNGAGKSTLLKILSRVTSPSEGVIKVKGKISSLLEVGTGFHGELTGRENIYLNGAILGMKKKQIDTKLDEIIDFSEIEHHIDTPVKRYSSGMYVRLAFAVAAHLDSDILIADEVLAVGDAAFQQKALGKMNNLSAGQGKTVLFVSHNMNAVESLCNSGVILQNGKLVDSDSNINSLISKYLYPTQGKNKRSECINLNEPERNKNFSLLKMYCTKNNNIVTHEICKPEDTARIVIESEIKDVNNLLNVGIFVKNHENMLVFSTWLRDKNSANVLKVGKNVFVIDLPVHNLNIGKHRVDLYAGLHHVEEIIPLGQYYIEINVSGTLKVDFGDGNREGIIAPIIKWDVNN